jgi:WD40 repeat protein
VAEEGSIRILAATTRKELLMLKVDFSLDCNFTFTADSQHLVTVGADDFARVWVTRNDIVPIKHDEPTRQFVCNPKRSLIASADADGVVRVWSADDGATIVDDKHDRITHLTLSPNGELLATAREDATTHVLDVQKRCRIAIFKHLDAVSNVTFSADGKLLATTSKDRTARV